MIDVQYGRDHPPQRKVAISAPVNLNLHEMDAINLSSLPNSVYLPSEQDYGLWPDSALSMAQTDAETGQQRESYMSFSDGLDFSICDDMPLMSDLSGSSASWDALPGPVAYDAAEAQPAQDERHR